MHVVTSLIHIKHLHICFLAFVIVRVGSKYNLKVDADKCSDQTLRRYTPNYLTANILCD